MLWYDRVRLYCSDDTGILEKQILLTCMQIEATCLYSLRQIYAARIFLFGIVDLFMISLFCITLRGSVNLALSEIVIQFFVSSRGDLLAFALVRCAAIVV